MTLICRCHKCILAARSDYFRAFLERSAAQPSTHTSLTPPSPLPDTSQTASKPNSPNSGPICHPCNDLPPKVDPASIATGGGDTEHAANQPCSCQQQHSSQQDTRVQPPSSDADINQAATTAQQQSTTTEHGAGSSGGQLPQLTVSNVSSEVFQLVLEFAYSGSLQVLPPRWLKAAGAELLFEAAQRYLMPLLKVLSPATLHHLCCHTAQPVLLHCPACATCAAAACFVMLSCCKFGNSMYCQVYRSTGLLDTLQYCAASCRTILCC